MTTRYSVLKPLDQYERANLCIMLCNFFSPKHNEDIRKQLDLDIRPNYATPLSIMNFFTWTKKQGNDLFPKYTLIKELILKLEQKGILIKASIPGINDSYWFNYELTDLAQKGKLWLGTALGLEYIGHEIKKVLVRITGKTKAKGDCSTGTGVLVLPGIVLTCAHVIDDMILDGIVEIEGQEIEICHSLTDSSIKADVGFISLKEKLAPSLPDLGFREARVLEEVVIAGFPSIPRSLTPIATLHRGEICGRIDNTFDGSPLELFSAIARPGNSGGPVVSLDGRIVGIVTRSLEREREEADSMMPLPFFSAVPSDILQSAFNKLTQGLVLPWENYQ